MSYLDIWLSALNESLVSAWDNFVLGYLPNLLGALIIFIIGLIVASGLRHLVWRIAELARLDSALVKFGVNEYTDKAGLKVDSGKLLGGLVYWFVFIAFLLAASDILSLTAFSSFLRDVLNYIPNVLVAVLIMLAAVVVANFLRGAVIAAVKSADMEAPHFLGSLTWWAVSVFGLFAALDQLGVAILGFVLQAFVVMLALAGGIAFGLGGKEVAEEALRKIKKQVEGK
ncbi:MAG: hypothetical protein HYT12_00665 [Candidatus Liptonbacteria bacterium]|nr:hypothetical protein [Candidatus Liptonbacteria bacterium]